MYSPTSSSGAAIGSSLTTQQNEQLLDSALAEINPLIPSSPIQSPQTNWFELINLNPTCFAVASATSTTESNQKGH